MKGVIEDNKSCSRLVVYGLLRRGGAMSPYLRRAKFIGKVILKGFDLFDCGEYPGIVPGDGKVIGELYELHECDLVEKFEPSLYCRKKIFIGGCFAWIYVYDDDVKSCKLIPSGDWFAR